MSRSYPRTLQAHSVEPGIFPDSGGRYWAVNGKIAHRSRSGFATSCGRIATTAWSIHGRNHFHPAEDGLEAKACGSCF